MGVETAVSEHGTRRRRETLLFLCGWIVEERTDKRVRLWTKQSSLLSFAQELESREFNLGEHIRPS